MTGAVMYKVPGLKEAALISRKRLVFPMRNIAHYKYREWRRRRQARQAVAGTDRTRYNKQPKRLRMEPTLSCMVYSCAHDLCTANACRDCCLFTRKPASPSPWGRPAAWSSPGLSPGFAVQCPIPIPICKAHLLGCAIAITHQPHSIIQYKCKSELKHRPSHTSLLNTWS